MSSSESGSDERTRRLMHAVQRLLPLDPRSGGGPEEQQQTRLRAAWHALVEALSPEPAPPRRACPRCGHPGMLEARRCGYCWVALVPVPVR